MVGEGCGGTKPVELVETPFSARQTPSSVLPFSLRAPFFSLPPPPLVESRLIGKLRSLCRGEMVQEGGGKRAQNLLYRCY